MWLLENEEIFEGRRLWLRPGKTYLFGRTAAEPGQLAVSHNTVSRKHLTITVDPVQEGHAHNLAGRSRLTVEDLATKIGTVVNGQKIKGSKHVVEGPEVEVMMGKCPSIFRLKWLPVVLTFSFTNKDLQAGPLMTLTKRFESLDIKLSTEYHVAQTTHVVSKKRNTAKGLQALINGKYVVTETFLDAIVQATQSTSDADPCPLEMDFTQHWPDPMNHLPPRGGEPVQHPNEIYAPDVGRKDVFDGYTFIFYDKTQYNNLLAPITDGCGKAMLHTISAGEERVEDFVRYVKQVAGEKGLGSFDDGSEGKGAVLVRYLPSKGDLVDWYTEFITSVSLRLDHRPIEQNEFLEAILIKDASKLRRPLEVESSEPTQTRLGSTTNHSARPEAESRPISEEGAGAPSQTAAQDNREEEPRVLRGVRRRPVKRRFVGFDEDDEDVDMDEPPAPARDPQSNQAAPEDDEGGLFVSQEPVASQPEQEHETEQSTRKRAGSPLPEDDLMEGMAPAVARFKRQRIAHADVFTSPEPERPIEKPSAASKKEPKKKAKEIDVLAMAARHREEEEARARAEREDLAQLPDDVDLAEIRRLNIVEEMEVRAPVRAPRTRDQDIADGRWDPKWNGVRNFKKFRPRGEAAARQPARVIVPLTQVRNKEFGVGDNYWLEDESSSRAKQASHRGPEDDTPVSAPPPPPPPPPAAVPARRSRATGFVVSDSSDQDDEAGRNSGAAAESEAGHAGTGSNGASAAQSQRGATSQASRQTRAGRAKRPAPEPAPEPRGKRARPAPRRTEMTDSDESDDELKFKFGRRR